MGLSFPGLCLAQTFLLPAGITNATDTAQCTALEKRWATPIKQIESQHDLCLKGSGCKHSGYSSGHRGTCTCGACESLHVASAKFKKSRNAQLKSCNDQVRAFNKLLADQRAETARQVREQAELKRASERAQAERLRAAQQNASELRQAQVRIKQKQEAELAALRRPQGSFRINQPSPPAAPRRVAPSAPGRGSGDGLPRPADNPSSAAGAIEAARTIADNVSEINRIRNQIEQIDRGTFLREQARARFQAGLADSVADTLVPVMPGGEVDRTIRRDVADLARATTGATNPGPVISSIQSFNNQVIGGLTSNTVQNINAIDSLMERVASDEPSEQSFESSRSSNSGGNVGRGGSRSVPRTVTGGADSSSLPDALQAEKDEVERQIAELQRQIELDDKANNKQNLTLREGSASESPAPRVPSDGAEGRNSPSTFLPLSEPGGADSLSLSDALQAEKEEVERQIAELRRQIDLDDKANNKQNLALREGSASDSPALHVLSGGAEGRNSPSTSLPLSDAPTAPAPALTGPVMAFAGPGMRGGYRGLSAAAVACYDKVISMKTIPAHSGKSSPARPSAMELDAHAIKALICLGGASSSSSVNAALYRDTVRACANLYVAYGDASNGDCYKGRLRTDAGR